MSVHSPIQRRIEKWWKEEERKIGTKHKAAEVSIIAGKYNEGFTTGFHGHGFGPYFFYSGTMCLFVLHYTINPFLSLILRAQH